MQELDSFKSQLKTLWSPTVAVIASDEAENLCLERNGLTVAELLRPFGTLRRMNGGMGVPIRTPAEQPIRLYDWTLHFHDISEMKQPPQEVANQHLAELLKQVAADASTPIPELDQLIEAANVDSASPWYGEYCKEFYRMLRFGSHEAIDHPVACLLVLPSTFEGEASSSFADLFEERATPLLKHLVRESHAVLHYAFLHDAQTAGSGVEERAVASLQSLTSSVGPSGHILTINSAGMPRAPPTTWQECVKQRWQGVTTEEKLNESSKIAAGMSQADATTIAAAVEELAVRKVAPHVESRIRYLDQTAMSARRGFKNQLKSLLFRKSAATTTNTATSATTGASPRGTSSPSDGSAALKGTTSSDVSSPRSPRSPTSRSATQYSLASVEAQLRQLSDLSLMVGDCDTALSVLRLLASDYKSDKAYFHYAGVQEAMAVATVLYDGPPSDAIANFKEAFYRYDQVAQQAQHGGPPSRATWYATRAAMLMANYLAALGRYADASYIVMKAHFAEEDLRAALLIERAALLLLRVRPARVRKFAFHLVLAGLRYSKGGARDLAARSYSLAVAVYKGREWEVVEEHVREALGKGCREAGDSLGAVQHFAATLTCSQIPAGLQSLHMTQFAESLQAATAQLGYQPSIQLPLPVVNASKVGVSSSGQASYANGAARQVAAELWAGLEVAVCQGLTVRGDNNRENNHSSGKNSSSSTWLDKGSQASLASASAAAVGSNGVDNLCCCVGEDVGVDLEIKNPLQIELAVTKLKLTCTFEAAAATTAAPASSTAAAAAVGSSSPFQVKEERITLHPGEQAVVHLRVKPLRTGSLNIDGVSWELNSIATGTKAFTIKKGDNLGFATINRYPDVEEKEKDVVDAVSDVFSGISVKVMPPMPRLELSLETLPPTLLVGQVTKCSLKLKNAGAMTLHALRCAIDTPSVFLELGPGQQVVHRPGKGHVFGLVNKGGGGASASGGGSTTKLGVNEEMEVTVYVRPTQPGPYSFNMCWYYEPLVKLEALPYRTLRVTFSASALPSLEMTAWSGPLAGGAGVVSHVASDSREGRMLVLRGLNLQGIESFALKQFEILGGDDSAKWSAVLTGKQKEESENATVKLDHVVGPESAVVLHAILTSSASTQIQNDGSGGGIAEKLKLLSLSPAQQYLADGEAKLLNKKKSNSSTASAGKKNSNTKTSTADKDSTVLVEPSQLVLHWEATGLSEGTVEGFNVIPISKVKGGLGLAARLLAPQRSVRHDFSISSVCGIDLALEICHEIPAALDVKWSTMPDMDSSNTNFDTTQGEQPMPIQGNGGGDDGVVSSQQKQPPSPGQQRFMWHGSTQATLHNVTPGSVVRVPLRLSVIAPGWVSIENCSVAWSCEAAPELDGALQVPACHFYVGEGGL